MQPLPLSPLPSAIPAEENPHVMRGDGDFVDEAVVRALMAGPIVSTPRENARPDVAASGNALDFAGWCLPRPAADSAGTRRPSPPVLNDPGAGQVDRGTPRRWLAGVAGAAFGSLTAMLLLHLPAQLPGGSATCITLRTTNAAAVRMQDDGGSRTSAPELTRLLDESLPQPVAGD
ncbi:MAG: hypothetical protein MUF86_01425 [Akkermansiaceae bacterium]|nr:hypothetical protein [Akkermansiaceae bacterium]